MKKNVRILSIFLALALILGLLAGCGGKKEEPVKSPDAPVAPDPSQAVPAGEPVKEDPSALGPTLPATVEGPEDNATVVSSVEELINAIKPDANILIKAGEYDLSEYLEKQNSNAWNDSHDYVFLDNCFDGVQLRIFNLENLTIRGEGSKTTKITCMPRYADVLCFKYVDDLTLSGLTIGHSEGGSCEGDVLYLKSCHDVKFDDLDLFGCGVNGIVMEECSRFEVTNSSVHDCEYDALQFNQCEGKFDFTDCTFTDNGWGTFSDDYDAIDVTFTRCRFGQNESNDLWFEDWYGGSDNEFMEPTQYPDVMPDVDPGYDGTGFVAFDEEAIQNNKEWVGRDDSRFSISFSDGRNGTLKGVGDPKKFSWAMSEYGDYAEIYWDGSTYSAGVLSFFKMEEDGPYQLCLSLYDAESDIYFIAK